MLKEEQLLKNRRPKTAPNDLNNQNERPNWIARTDRWLEKFENIPTAEKLFFIQQLAIMLKAGISLGKALEMLYKQTANKRFKVILKDIHVQILSGNSLADALKRHQKIFGELFVNMVGAGEASGTLEKVLHHLYLELKKSNELKRKIRGAMAYPIIILCAMAAIGIGVMIFVVPKFISIFKEVNLELPLMTKILIKVSDAITNHGLVVGVLLLAAIIILIQLLKTKSGRGTWHWLMLKLPVIGPIVKKINLARFSRTLSSLLATDIKIVESFKITASTLNNELYRRSLLAAAEKIKKGVLINKILAQYPDLYNHVILQMIAVGEETGELDSILAEIAGFYESEVDEVMNTLPTIIEPIIILILAVAIGSMAVAIIMPMYSLTNAF